nr:helix-turn-helix transcriptional regulator [Sinorhizobium sp. BG8]
MLTETNLLIVDFYLNQGIELLGETAIGKEPLRTGARWVAPQNPDASEEVKKGFRSQKFPISFRAARALLEMDQAQVAEAAGLTVAIIQNLERGRLSAGPLETLRNWYEKHGVDFLGWGDAASSNYYGVGVRWKSHGRGTEDV